MTALGAKRKQPVAVDKRAFGLSGLFHWCCGKRFEIALKKINVGNGVDEFMKQAISSLRSTSKKECDGGRAGGCLGSVTSSGFRMGRIILKNYQCTLLLHNGFKNNTAVLTGLGCVRPSGGLRGCLSSTGWCCQGRGGPRQAKGPGHLLRHPRPQWRNRRPPNWRNQGGPSKAKL